MDGLIENLYSYYYLVLILQGICVFHSIRRGNQNKWIWIIVFLPLIGCIAYIFTEVIQKNDVSSIQSGVAGIVNPGGKIKELERKFNFSDTFKNRVALADAYLSSGMNEKAIELYEPALNGLFDDNEHVIKQLAEAYFNTGRYDDVIRIVPKIFKSLFYSKSHTKLLYALSLEQTGKSDLAYKEFKEMDNRFSNYEARYHFLRFLVKNNRHEEAEQVFQNISDEDGHMNRSEKRDSKVWIDKAKAEWTAVAG